MLSEIPQLPRGLEHPTVSVHHGWQLQPSVGVMGVAGRISGAPAVTCVSPISQAWFTSGVDHEDLPVQAEVVSVKHIKSLCVH